jgi:hypothetical protein
MVKPSLKLLFFSCILWSCSVSKPNANSDGTPMPFRIEIIKDSREVVLVQTLPWEEQMMGYFKVLNTAPGYWQMWYSSWDNKRKDDYSGYLVYAHSADGKEWIKEIPGKENNILKGTGHPQKDGVVEQDVFIEPAAIYKYKMIYTAKDLADDGKEKTFIEESKDGVNWVNKKILWSRKHDSQFSVIQRDSLYYIYLRYWDVKNNVRYRTIGLAITDKNWNTIQEPQNIFKGDYDGAFPHLYNPAASKISKDLDILFPTFFNEKTNAIKFGLTYVYKGKPVSTQMDFTKDLLENEKANWGIISPGLIPAGKNTYWMYYYATNMVHSDYDKAGRRFSYYRIKVKIKEH